jgi:hypothetical protein
MLKRFAFFVLLISIHCISLAQTNDIKVVLHEEMINKVLAAVGPFSDTSSYKVLFIKGTYKWTVLSTKIKLLNNGKAEYVCNVKVEVGPFDYTSEVIGDAIVYYDRKTNLINIKILHGIFEVYTKVLGKKFHIKDIDIAEYFTEPLTFEGPKSMYTDFDFTLPDGTVKKIYAIPMECDLVVSEKIISVTCEMNFTEKKPAEK